VVGDWQNKVGLTRYPYVYSGIFVVSEWQDASNNPMNLCEILNLDNKPRKLMWLIVCMGAKKLSEEFPTLVLVVWIIGHIVMWFSDPVHGSTINVASGLKTWRFDAILVNTLFHTMMCGWNLLGLFGLSLNKYWDMVSPESFFLYYPSLPIVCQVPIPINLNKKHIFFEVPNGTSIDIFTFSTFVSS